MQASGYDHQFYLEILKSAINAHNKMKEEEREGKKIYRKREWRRDERIQKKEKRKKNWYTKGEYKPVIFIAATPNSELAKKLQGEINKTDVKLKVIEKSGMKIIRHLQQNDPFKEKMCADREKCSVCSGPNPGNCRETGVSYRNDYPDECSYECTGQTGLNAYARGKGIMETLCECT